MDWRTDGQTDEPYGSTSCFPGLPPRWVENDACLSSGSFATFSSAFTSSPSLLPVHLSPAPPSPAQPHPFHPTYKSFTSSSVCCIFPRLSLFLFFSVPHLFLSFSYFTFLSSSSPYSSSSYTSSSSSSVWGWGTYLTSQVVTTTQSTKKGMWLIMYFDKEIAVNRIIFFLFAKVSNLIKSLRSEFSAYI